MRVMAALPFVLSLLERVLTRAQWNALPDRVRDPYQVGGGMRAPGG
jgi:hypothetical protein